MDAQIGDTIIVIEGNFCGQKFSVIEESVMGRLRLRSENGSLFTIPLSRKYRILNQKSKAKTRPHNLSRKIELS